MPDIGPYDIWSIEYGYRLIKDADSPEAERPVINAWIKEKAGDPVYRFGRQRGIAVDPHAQTEDLGDNSMKASEYGIKNLQRIVPNLIEWTGEDTKDFSELKEFYNAVTAQFNRYLGHVVANVGGIHEYYKSFDENSVIYTHTVKEKQKAAVDFLNEHLFKTPLWLGDTEVLRRIEETGFTERIRSMQERILSALLNKDRVIRMLDNEVNSGKNAFTLQELFTELNKGIFSELSGSKNIDLYRRNLQRVYIDQLGLIIKSEDKILSASDLKALTRVSLKEIDQKLRVFQTSDNISKHHRDDLRERIAEILTYKKA
jgi:hypothetical protein